MLKRFGKDRKGLAAVEFALIAPVMVLIFYGATELSSALDCNARVGRVSATVADLVAQSTSVSTTDTTNVFGAANAILYPFASSNAKIVVTSLVSDANNKVTVGWSEAQNTPKRTTVPANIPASILPANSSLIYAEVTYRFTPAASFFLGTVDLKSTFFAKPRRSSKVNHS